MMTVLSPVSPDDDAAAVLAGLVGDGSLGESPINATDDVAGNAAEGTTQFKASTACPWPMIPEILLILRASILGGVA